VVIRKLVEGKRVWMGEEGVGLRGAYLLYEVKIFGDFGFGMISNIVFGIIYIFISNMN
jgi:hypothetical protein